MAEWLQVAFEDHDLDLEEIGGNVTRRNRKVWKLKDDEISLVLQLRAPGCLAF